MSAQPAPVEQGSLWVQVSHGLERAVGTLPLPAAKADPQTSHDAVPSAARIAAGIRDAVRALAAWTGLPPTSLELADGDPDRRYMLARRLPDALKLALVAHRAPRECRVSGRKAVTWTLTETGRALARERGGDGC